VFGGVQVEVCALFIRHVAIGKPFEIGSDKVRCYDFGNEKQLSNATISNREQGNSPSKVLSERM